MAMVFRFFHAFGGEQRPFQSSKGFPTGAVYGMAKLLNRIITEMRPDFLVATTDSKEPTFRHEMYPPYKANRKEMPPLIAKQLPEFFKLLSGFQIKMIQQSGLEADDLIGSLVRKFASSDCHCYIISGDKDFCQLVNDQVFLLNPFQKGDEILDIDQVKSKYQINPDQFVDYLALIGDDSDNIPGCHGIGKVGAVKLLQEFATLDGIYENLEKIHNKKSKEALIKSHELTYLSQKLATIKTDAPLPFDKLDDFKAITPDQINHPRLVDQYIELEFQSILRDIKAQPIQESLKSEEISAPKVMLSDDLHYKLVIDTTDLESLCLRLIQAPLIAVDTETTGLSPINDQPIGICLADGPGQAFYIPLLPEHTKIPQDQLRSMVSTVLQASNTKVGHNLKFDLQMLSAWGLSLAGPLMDTMVMDWLLTPGAGGHGLDACCERHLQFKKTPTSSIFDLEEKATSHGATLKVPLETLSHYGCEDADYTLRLFHHLLPLIKDQDLTYALEKVEMPMVPILAQMERYGIAIDEAMLSTLSKHLDQLAEERAQEVYQLAGLTFNINSPKQLAEVIFEKLKIHEQLGIQKLKKTKSGYSTDESVLTRLKAHPLPKLILEYRTVTKLKNTYVDALPKLIQEKTHCIHTTYHQTGTATGRLSSSDPNLQNIPIRSSLGQEIRRAFKPSIAGWILVSADYSQVELRILAHLAHETALIEAFRKGEDIHKTTAAKIFGVAPDQVDGSMRSKAKAINFGIIYGMGPMRLAQETGVSMGQAVNFIKKYFESYPGIKIFVDETIQFSKQHHYVKTITGRRRAIDWGQERPGRQGPNLDNIAINSPIQGSAADLIKLAMGRVAYELKEQRLKARMLLQVHDELVFETPPGELETLVSLIQKAMTQAISLDVPLEVNIGHGPNWLEAH